MKNISSKNAGERLIFALDVQNYEDALSLVDLLSGHVGMFKIGKELFTAAGPKIIRAIKERNQKVFLDLKFHDIPNTVARAAEAVRAARAGGKIVNACGHVQRSRVGRFPDDPRVGFRLMDVFRCTRSCQADPAGGDGAHQSE